ncbi:MAG: hypothetical protein U0V72_05745 [Cytophagales bacterium]
MQNTKFAILFILFSLFINSFGQNTNPENEEQPVPEINFNERKTNNIENQQLDINSVHQKEKKYLKLKKTNSKNTYTGNMCAEEITRAYNFEYEVDHVAGMGSAVRYYIGNQFKIFYLNFKNGLFWRYRFKRDLRNCISRTGDFIG